jgi:mevalonate pyrophosphate decarboxylase
LDLSSAACFISPKKSAIGFPVHLFAHSERKLPQGIGPGTSSRVIAGLDPAIHAELHFSMDHRGISRAKRRRSSNAYARW